MRHFSLSLFLALLPISLRAQQTGGTEAWTGCWVLQTTSDEHLTRSDSVRLRSVVLPSGSGEKQYRGTKLSDKPGGFSGWVSWSQGEHGDSADIRVEALGGTVWRLVPKGDSLVGYAYVTFDIIPGEHAFGPASGRRLKC
jgi:hypothetical protein